MTAIYLNEEVSLLTNKIIELEASILSLAKKVGLGSNAATILAAARIDLINASTKIEMLLGNFAGTHTEICSQE